MTEKKETYNSLSIDTLARLMVKSGCRDFTKEAFMKDVDAGFPLNEDGTVDLFDYTSWLFGMQRDNPPPRTPPVKGFNTASVSPQELAGWLNLYNHLGYEITANRMTETFRSYKFRFQAKDSERNIDFPRFVAFIFSHRPKRGVGRPSANDYERYKATIAKRNKEMAAMGRDIGDLPPVVNPERKEACRMDFRLFCETYFPQTFPLEFSEDHLNCISKIELSVLEGGLFAMALPRGSGKTTLSEIAAVWSMAYGHRQFVCLVGATETAAQEMLSSIKTEFETNELLEEDFPEICYPILSLEGIANRCNGQTFHGERTRITWTSDELVLPTIEGSAASGIVVRVAGLTGRIRGMKYKRPDGKTVRPQLVIVDDPQTRESARSLEQNKNRTKILSGDILGLAGPGQKISGIMPCTIIEPGDMADQILDREKHPEWNGEKAKMLKAPPSNMELWDTYSELRADGLREDGNYSRATQFYIENREKMDEGAVVYWPERFDADEVSAVQNAMNLLLRDPVAFASEYQNEPLKEDMSEESIMTADAISQKLNGIDRLVVPLECTHLTMFVDVQKKCLFYTVCAWADDFTGAVIDYGTYPEQKARRFTMDDIKPTLQELWPHSSIEAQLYSGMTKLFKEKMNAVYVREDGTEMKIDRAAIDANWGTSTDIVYQYCRQGEFTGLVIPSHGHFVGASSIPMSEHKKKQGEKVGLNWYMPSGHGSRAARHVVFDTNFWKSFIHARFASPIGEHGCLTLYGRNPISHELYSEHLTAEYRVKTQGRGRTCDEWRIRPDRKDNHWLDCTAGCAVLASMLGSSLPQQEGIRKAKEPVKLSDMKPSTERHDMYAVEAPPPARHAAGAKVKIRLSDIHRR